MGYITSNEPGQGSYNLRKIRNTSPNLALQCDRPTYGNDTDATGFFISAFRSAVVQRPLASPNEAPIEPHRLGDTR